MPKGLPIGAGKYLLVSLLGFVYRELTIVDFPTEGAEIGVEYKLYRERGNIDYLGDNIPVSSSRTVSVMVFIERLRCVSQPRAVPMRLVLRTRVRSVFDVQLGASWSMLRLDAPGMRSTHHDMSQFIETQLHVGPARVGISVDRVAVEVDRTHPNAIYFLDAEVEVDVIQSRLTFYVEGRNLMNSRYYSQKSGSNIETLSMRYEIPALRVIGGVRWQF